MPRRRGDGVSRFTRQLAQATRGLRAFSRAAGEGFRSRQNRRREARERRREEVRKGGRFSRFSKEINSLAAYRVTSLALATGVQALSTPFRGVESVYRGGSFLGGIRAASLQVASNVPGVGGLFRSIQDPLNRATEGTIQRTLPLAAASSADVPSELTRIVFDIELQLALRKQRQIEAIQNLAETRGFNAVLEDPNNRLVNALERLINKLDEIK